MQLRFCTRHLAHAALALAIGLVPAFLYAQGAFVFVTTRCTYDDAGRLKTVVYDDAAAIAYEYDLNGNRTLKLVAGPDDPNADGDGDTISDLWELTHFQSLGIDPGGNPDGDAMNNYAESRAWTNPTNAASYLAMVSISNALDTIALNWAETHSNATYRLWWTGALTNWDIANSAVVGAGAGAYLDAAATNPAARFYRVSVEP